MLASRRIFSSTLPALSQRYFASSLADSVSFLKGEHFVSIDQLRYVVLKNYWIVKVVLSLTLLVVPLN